MKTYVECDGSWFPATLTHEKRIDPGTAVPGIISSLCVDLGDDCFYRVEKWDREDQPVDEDGMRRVLASAIRARSHS